MICKYRKFTENSPNGISLDLQGKSTYLGNIDGWDYAYLSEEIEQDERLEAAIVELTEEEKIILKNQRFVEARKQYARLRIEEDVGDIYDLLADAMKLIEFNLVLAARFAGDAWGTNPIAPDVKETFKARNKMFLDAIDSGAIVLRGDFDDMDSVMQKMFERVSSINTIVRDKYLADLREVGL
mgnify:CR=1 FL=1